MKLLPLLLAITIPAAAQLAAAFDQTHSAFTEILGKHVKGDTVDYAALKQSPDKLGAYLDSLAKVTEPEFSVWSEDQEMAYLINLYNAATLKLIIDNQPLESIKDIGSPWKKKFVTLFGELRSLDHIEHELLRKNYNDPRIHFGVNCASIGCPALRNEAFQAPNLDKQLDEQARHFLQDETKNRVDASKGILQLSPIFDWFKGDFVKKAGSLEKFVAPYFDGADQKAIESGKLKVKFGDYNWNLNK